MIKLITILFLALIFWLFLFGMADAIARFAICADKAIRKYIKKWRRCR